MLKLEQGELLSLKEAARLLPGKVNISTLFRWSSRGTRGVRLQTWLIGGRRFTNEESLEKFIIDTTAAADGNPLPVRTSKQRQAGMEQAEKEIGGDAVSDGPDAVDVNTDEDEDPVAGGHRRSG